MTLRSMNSNNNHDEELQKGLALRKYFDNSGFEVLCKSKDVPTFVQSKNPLLDGVVILHPSKKELDLPGQRRGGDIFEVAYGDDLVRFETAGIETKH